MPRITSAAARSRRRRAAHQRRLVTALLVVCSKVRRLQTSPEIRAAYDDVARWLRAMPRVPAHRRSGKKD
jgi:hypothetical protein